MIGILVIVGDRYQVVRRSAWRLPVLGVALGMYLPLKLSAAIFMGGILAEVVSRAMKPSVQEGSQSGLLCAAGLVTGEALMGILLAVPVALSSLWPASGPGPVPVVFRTAMGCLAWRAGVWHGCPILGPRWVGCSVSRHDS